MNLRKLWLTKFLSFKSSGVQDCSPEFQLGTKFQEFHSFRLVYEFQAGIKFQSSPTSRVQGWNLRELRLTKFQSFQSSGVPVWNLRELRLTKFQSSMSYGVPPWYHFFNFFRTCDFFFLVMYRSCSAHLTQSNA